MSTRVLAGLALALAVVLAACGAGTYDQQGYDPHARAAVICLDEQGYRVPDTYCPIGDGITNAGPAGVYGWGYSPYRDTDPDIDVVLVGYRAPANYSRVRPARVATLNLDRGRFPESPPAGSAPASSERVATIDASRNVTRGGLGITGTRASTAPLARSTSSPAPGRVSTSPAAKPRPNPPPPTVRMAAPAARPAGKPARR